MWWANRSNGENFKTSQYSYCHMGSSAFSQIYYENQNQKELNNLTNHSSGQNGSTYKVGVIEKIRLKRRTLK